MTHDPYVPHIDFLLASLRLTRDRLQSRGKVAIPVVLLKKILVEVAKAQPFDESFYRDTYPDLSSAHDAGLVKDLRSHFFETGWLEGRMGAAPKIDEAFYLRQNADVQQAVASGVVASATDHYMRSGASEGRVPHPDLVEIVAHWREAIE
jgi:hypothetical protein